VDSKEPINYYLLHPHMIKQIGSATLDGEKMRNYTKRSYP
jgi:hypothetical protein